MSKKKIYLAAALSKKRAATLTRRQKFVLDTFADAAMCHGNEQDRGVGSSVDEAERSYNESFKDMTQLLLDLNEKIRRLKCIVEAGKTKKT